MKKFLLSVFIILLFSGTLFFFGWIQFAVPAGTYGVLISKTGGINTRPVVPAQFRWQWERLIPTNTELLVFSLPPITYKLDSEGTLPSGEIYSGMLEGRPDFSWKTSLNITYKLKPEMLPVLVNTYAIRTQEALESWTSAEISRIATESCNKVVAGALNQEGTSPGADPSLFLETLKKELAAEAGTNFEIISVTVDQLKTPDLSLYTTAARAYASYQQQRTTLIANAASQEAEDSVSEYLQIERFSRLGEVLTRYPILIDFLAVSQDDAESAFKAVKTLRETR